MEYLLSEESFNQTFGIENAADGTPLQLKHHSPGQRIRLFPFKTHRESPELSLIVGEYLRFFEEDIPSIDRNELKERISDHVQTEKPQELFQIISELYFEKNDAGEYLLRPLNVEFMSTIPCENKYCRLAYYLASTLGTYNEVRSSIEKNRTTQHNKCNVLEKFLISEFHKTEASEGTSITEKFFKVIDCLDGCFNEDFEYIVSSESRSREYLLELLSLYYFTYTVQSELQLNRFFEGERDQLSPIYFCLEWEKTNQNRLCYKQGWKFVNEALTKMFSHANVLEMLNQTNSTTDEPIDYIRLNELISEGMLNDFQVAAQIREISNIYVKHIVDCPEIAAIDYEDFSSPTEKEIHHLFKCVEKQFELKRSGPRDKYKACFTDFCKTYLQNRGRSGDMLCISEDRLIFLTKLCIKDQPKMRLNDVFTSFEKRGISFDAQSKIAITEFYEKLNLIEKKSDSGDAQYVKRIL